MEKPHPLRFFQSRPRHPIYRSFTFLSIEMTELLCRRFSMQWRSDSIGSELHRNCLLLPFVSRLRPISPNMKVEALFIFKPRPTCGFSLRGTVAILFHRTLTSRNRLKKADYTLNGRDDDGVHSEALLTELGIKTIFNPFRRYHCGCSAKNELFLQVLTSDLISGLFLKISI